MAESVITDVIVPDADQIDDDDIFIAQGAKGWDGWTPLLGLVSDADRMLLKVTGWAGGYGPEPAAGLFVGANGLTEDITQAISIKGFKGDIPAHSWDGTAVRFQNPDGTPGAIVDLKGAKGDKGDRGYIPKGVFTANTVYAQDDTVTYSGSTYRRLTPGNSGNAGFDSANWEVVAQGGGVTDGAVVNNTLSPEVAVKNLPFHPTSNPHAILKAAIKNIRLYGADPNKSYVLTTLRRNVTLSNVSGYWQILVFEWDKVANAIGPAFLQWTSLNYVPTAQVETIEFISGTKAFQIMVDWSAVPDGTHLQSMNFTASGISPLVLQSVSAGLFADKSIAQAKLSDELAYKNYPWGIDVNPNTTFRGAIRKVTIVGFPDTSKQLTISVLRRNVTLSGVANTWEVSIHEWINGAFGNAVYRFSSVGYTPSKNVETITLAGISSASGTIGTNAYMIIDWTAVADNFNGQGNNYTGGGLSYLVHNPTQPLSISDNSIPPVKLSADVLYKNFPWQVDAVVPTICRNGIRNIQIAGLIDSSKKLSVTILRRNVTISGEANIWQIAVYDVTNAAFGSTIYNWRKIGYTPSASIETLELPGVLFGLNTTMYITVDWDQIPDGTSLDSRPYNQTGISHLVARPGGGSSVIGDGSLQTAKYADSSVTQAKISAEVQLKNFPFQSLATPNATFRNGIRDVRVIGTIDPNKILTIGVLRRNVTISGVTGNWQVVVHEVTGGVFTSYYSFSQINYVPSANLEWITLSSTNSVTAGTTMLMLVDWSAIANGTSSSSVAYASAGLSPLIFLPQGQQAQQYDIVLPPKLYGFAGSQYYFYDDTLIYNYHILEKRPARLWLEAKKLSDGSVVTPVAYPATNSPNFAPYVYMQGMGYLMGAGEDLDVTFKIENYAQSDAVATSPSVLFQKTVQLIHKQKPAARTIDVLPIGDSYINNKNGEGILAYWDQFAAAEGYTLNFKGTRIQYTINGKTYMGEGRGSWSENTFFRYVQQALREPVNGDPTKATMSSPFMFSSDDTVANAQMDIAQYLTVNNIGNVDVVMIHLGMNGGNGTNLNIMISKIKEALPNAKIVVCMVPGAERTRYNFNSNSRQIGRLNQNKSYINLFAGREAEGIYLCPLHMNFHRVYSLRHSTQEQIQFNLDSIPKLTVNIDHHPNASGEKGEAFMIHQYTLAAIA